MSVTQEAVKKIILEYIGGAKIKGAGSRLVAGEGREVIVKSVPAAELLAKLKGLIGQAGGLRDSILQNPQALVIDKMRSEIADIRAKVQVL